MQPLDPAHLVEVGDYTSYQPLAKTAWSHNGGSEHELSFGDLLDAINPLQHLPIISTIYRAITGEKIGLAARLVGDGIYGGPIGFLSSGVSAVLESGAGKSTGEMLAGVARGIFGPAKSDPAPIVARAVAEPEPESAPARAVEPSAALEHATAPEQLAQRGDEASQRIARSVEEAQRVQAGLLLASIQQPEPTPRPDRTERAEAGKSAANPYMPPQAASSGTGWSSESLAETIARYERAVAANRR